AEMATAFYGQRVDQTRIPALASPIWEGKMTAAELLRAMKALGFDWSEQHSYVSDFGEACRRLEKPLADKRPVLVTVQPTKNRNSRQTMLLIGLDAQSKTATLLDPRLAAPGRRTLSFTEFE